MLFNLINMHLHVLYRFNDFQPIKLLLYLLDIFQSRSPKTHSTHSYTQRKENSRQEMKSG